MFDALSDRFDGIFKRLRGKGRLSEADVDEVLREIRLGAARGRRQRHASSATSIARIKEQARSAPSCRRASSPASRSSRSSTTSSSPPSAARRSRSPTRPKPPTVVLMAGLQGSGKTTAAGKLARWFKRQGRNPLLVGADLQRPAAVEQLRMLGRQVDVPCLQRADAIRSTVARRGVDEAAAARPRRRHRRHRRPARRSTPS